MNDGSIPEDLSAYLDALVPPRPPALAAMEKEAEKTGFPIVGPSSGQFCYLVARAIGARRIFELGSGFGYSTAWLARAAVENGGGTVHHTVRDEALSARAKRELAALGYADTVSYHVGDAVAALEAEKPGFDLIFDDIDKDEYPSSLRAIAEKLRPGGVLLVDNMLWHARVLDPTDRSSATESVRSLTRLVVEDPGWIASLVPIRDGILFAYKR
jgi:caffeoyl-CoA O-methyltransferase